MHSNFSDTLSLTLRFHLGHLPHSPFRIYLITYDCSLYYIPKNDMELLEGVQRLSHQVV